MPSSPMIPLNSPEQNQLLNGVPMGKRLALMRTNMNRNCSVLQINQYKSFKIYKRIR